MISSLLSFLFIEEVILLNDFYEVRSIVLYSIKVAVHKMPMVSINIEGAMLIYFVKDYLLRSFPEYESGFCGMFTYLTVTAEPDALFSFFTHRHTEKEQCGHDRILLNRDYVQYV